MCGRARLPEDYSEIKIQLGLDDFRQPDFRPSWNIPPTAPMLVVRLVDGRRRSEMMRWSLIPSWSKDGHAGSTFNARAETLREKPTFRDAWRKGRRCLVVTSGFYEWRKRDKQAFAVGMADDSLMVMAGLWEEWTSPDGELINTCTIITTEANAAMAEVHDRMPVILDKTDWPKWLGEVPATEDELYALLKPAPPERVKIWPVDNRVGNVRINEPRLLDEIKPIGTLL
jgi:putative SOS response-associated peptidase YedK